MIRSELRTEIRYILSETTADHWSDAELNGYLNEALRRLAGENRWSWLLTEGTGQLIAGDPEFILQEGVAEYRHLNIMLTRDGDTRPYLPKRVSPARGFALRQAFYTAQSYPTWFYVTSVADDDNDGVFWTTVRFVPTPNVDVDIDYQYYRQPATLDADGDAPDVPVQYHKALVHHAAGTAWLKELGPSSAKAQEQFSLYAGIVEEARTDEESQADDDLLVVGGEEPVFDRLVTPDEYVRWRIADTLG